MAYKRFLKHLKETTYMHGVTYLFDQSRIVRYFMLSIKITSSHKMFQNVSYRIFWTFLFIIGICASICLLRFVLETFLENRITVNLETSYLNWKHTFPAVSICMMEPFDWEIRMKYRAYMETYLMNNGFEPPSEYEYSICLYWFIRTYLIKNSLLIISTFVQVKWAMKLCWSLYSSIRDKRCHH